MNVLTISDWHLGGGGPADDFTADTMAVEFLYRNRDLTIICNGDMFELLQFSQSQIENTHGQVCQALEDYANHIIVGNHDIEALRICNHPTEPDLLLDSTVWAHGHQFDIYNSGRGAWIGRMGAALALFAEQIWPDADYYLVQFAHWLTGTGRYGEQEAYRAKALKFAKEHWLDGMVLGHTHQSYCSNGYWNSGTWTRGKRDYVILEL